MTLKIQHGQFAAVHSHNFTAKGIQLFMNILRWTTLNFKPFYKYVYNHSLSGLPDNTILEAIPEGTVIKDFNESYQGKKNKTIHVYQYDWSPEQLEECLKVSRELEGIPYQFPNFLQWPIRIFTFGLLWIGRRGRCAMNQTYCIEDQVILLYRMTSPGLAKNDTDREIHKLCNKFWRPSPLLYMHILETYFTKVAVFNL